MNYSRRQTVTTTSNEVCPTASHEQASPAVSQTLSSHPLGSSLSASLSLPAVCLALRPLPPRCRIEGMTTGTDYIFTTNTTDLLAVCPLRQRHALCAASPRPAYIFHAGGSTPRQRRAPDIRVAWQDEDEEVRCANAKPSVSPRNRDPYTVTKINNTIGGARS